MLQEVEIELIFALRTVVLFLLYGQRFPRYGLIFKIVISGYETWQLAKVSEVAPEGVEIELMFALRTTVSDIWADFQNCHIWALTWQVGKVPEVAHIHSFYPRGAKLSLFLLYGQRFVRYGPIFKIVIFGYETSQVAKVREVAHIHIFCSRVSKLSLF